MDDLELDDCACHSAGTGTGGEAAGRSAISEIASQSFGDDAPLHRVVTFLNKSLRRRGYVFGIMREGDKELKMTIYEIENSGL